MLDIYRSDGDMHASTTCVIYHIPIEEAMNKNPPLYKTRRTISKNRNFGVAYGLYPRGLRRTLKFRAGLNTTLAERATIITNLRFGYPQLAKRQESAKEQARGRLYVETSLGRRRHLPAIDSDDWGKRSFDERCAMNIPIQGTAADILKIALGRILAGLPEQPWIHPLLQIHDEVLLKVPVDRITDATRFVKSCIEAQSFQEFGVPIVAESSVEHRFGELHNVEGSLLRLDYPPYPPGQPPVLRGWPGFQATPHFRHFTIPEFLET
jgi:DNA polymerase-1